MRPIRDGDRFVAFAPRKIAGSERVPAVEEFVDDLPPPGAPPPQPDSSLDENDAGNASEEPRADVRPPAPTDPAGFSSFARDDIEAALRARAIELATAATARALGTAAAADQAVIARFVDDAAAAAGACSMQLCRLNPDDAQMREVRGLAVIADPAIQRGGLVLEGPGVCLGASVEERAELLVRREADA